MLLLCREYYFLDTENSRYFILSSKTRGHTKRSNASLKLLSLSVASRFPFGFGEKKVDQ